MQCIWNTLFSFPLSTSTLILHVGAKCKFPTQGEPTIISRSDVISVVLQPETNKLATTIILGRGEGGQGAIKDMKYSCYSLS